MGFRGLGLVGRARERQASSAGKQPGGLELGSQGQRVQETVVLSSSAWEDQSTLAPLLKVQSLPYENPQLNEGRTCVRHGVRRARSSQGPWPKVGGRQGLV